MKKTCTLFLCLGLLTSTVPTYALDAKKVAIYVWATTKIIAGAGGGALNFVMAKAGFRAEKQDDEDCMLLGGLTLGCVAAAGAIESGIQDIYREYTKKEETPSIKNNTL